MTDPTAPSPAVPSDRAVSAFPVLLFDLDGTLIDSAPDLAAALNRVLAVNGRPMLPFPRIRGLIGNGARKLVERGFRATGGPPDDLDAETERFLAIYGRALACHSALYPGVAETLAVLSQAGHRLAIVTNKPLAPTRAILGAFALAPYFGENAVAGGDSFAEKKPHPAPLAAMLARLETPPHAAVMIGDSHNDIDAARAAGIATVAVGYGYARGDPAALGADRLIASFGDLPAALASLAATPRRP